MDDETVRKLREEGNQGVRAAQAGRMDLAGQHFNKALGLAEDLEDDRQRRDEISVLSMVFDDCGLPDLALIAAEESVELDRKLGLDDLVHQDLLNVGTAHLNLGNHAKAEACFREALKLALARKEWANAASASTNLGKVFAQREEWKQSIESYETSLGYLERGAFEDTEINTRLMLLQVGELGGYDAERAVDNARRLCERFWKVMQGQKRQAAEVFVPQAVERYLKARPQGNPGAWKAKTFPMIFR
jgi:tetratricopeptide (TPR) repeat protein